MPARPSNDLFSELQVSIDDKLLQSEIARNGLQEEVKDREKAAFEMIFNLDFRHVRQQKDVTLDRFDHLLKGDDANADKSADLVDLLSEGYDSSFRSAILILFGNCTKSRSHPGEIRHRDREKSVAFWA
ncbi:unnamed protein product [Cylicocyclus nassatus]|uniref:Uncharacterized protein n=1 Tax=Cylicocyclus nassatus TaxID=53992 RepID=A0AA36DLX6_CYLNA|nr:unnamed protein product [Cylicocyclus nassatus]